MCVSEIDTSGESYFPLSYNFFVKTVTSNRLNSACTGSRCGCVNELKFIMSNCGIFNTDSVIAVNFTLL